MEDPQRKGPPIVASTPRYIPPTITPPPPAPTVIAPPAEKENIKETIESILVAFILAFVFRAFVVEAFVIPSGSMAPTLLGAHMRYRCEDCGYEWTVNFPTPDREDISIPRNAWNCVYSVRCPNC